jgi:tyrosyl-tRNA synthetase
MSNVYNTLLERGYIKQLTHEEEIIDLLENNKVAFYTGFDPTADSLHVGHFLQLMVMSHMQKAGHRPIVLIGGGTAMVGDPTGKTDMRRMLTKEEIENNVACFKEQMSKFLDFGEGKAMIVNNGDWLLNLNYVNFLRDVGVHFSVNKMLTAECFKTRLEKGLSFLEFNYMLMQGFDFYELNQRYNCCLELGGDDQWANILGGIELIRKKLSKPAYGMTFKLLTTSEGKKMGKTEGGAVWLNPEKTSPYEFYQYWRNVDDADVENCLALLTYLPMDEVRRLGALKDSAINEAKKVLAYEVTKIVHGVDAADAAKQAAEALFGGSGDMSSMPATDIAASEVENGLQVTDLLVKCEIAPSKSEARRLIKQGGISINDEKINDMNAQISINNFKDGYLIIKKGKKVYHKVNVK